MEVIINIIGIMLLLWVLLSSLLTPSKAIPLAVLTLVGSFSINFFDYNFIAKMLVVLTCGISILRYGYNKKLGKGPFLLLTGMFLVQFFVNYFRFNPSYGFIEFSTSFATIAMGFFLIYTKWSDINRKFALKMITWSAIFAVLVGVLDKRSFFVDGRIVSVGLFAHLPFWSSLGIYSAILLDKYYKQSKYRIFIYLNFFIVLLTQSRGGAIFAFVIILPFIVNGIKKLNMKFLFVITFISPLVLGFIYVAITKLIDRTLVNGSINTTNRFEAWSVIYELSSNNRVFGLGIGSLKTVTGEYIISQGFSAAHNEYLRFLYESGVIGLLIIVCAMIIVFKMLLKNYIIEEKKYAYFLITGFLIYSLTDNTVSAGEFWGPFMLCVSLSFSSIVERNWKYEKQISERYHSSI
ncbi:O-antigen ligase family protein [Bacillus sp. SJS]|uniref:O-antigen ligase family protein n=1 Tax=Bacillus sp. SJS TaxID=1423321 RepID=UPI0004DCFD25|nr:O-antigen ligase family protein [Bacillus sp. SJS]KZZ83902.1 hypothetical protein AS29_014225 [Bacillus sp. SJS]